jgi:hypothetical protein
MSKYRIVVSAENTPYMAWQCQLFHFSCVSRLGITPTIIVHRQDPTLHNGFREIVMAGGRVEVAPSYRVTSNGFDYAPRNTPGSLLHAVSLLDSDDEFIVLCDPDMIFSRAPSFGEGLSGDFYSYLDYGKDTVQEAAAKLGLSRRKKQLQKDEFRCGVPHVIPRAFARDFAEVWLESIDAFPPTIWERSMYAFGFAALQLKKTIQLTHIVDHNGWPREPVRGDMIHYCYGDDKWSKRAFITSDQVTKVWTPHLRAPRKTILGEMLAQIDEARRFYYRFEM